MSVCDDLAKQISGGLVTNQRMTAEEVGASPFIDFITQLLQTLLPMLLTCLPAAATAEDVHKALTNLSLIQRARLLLKIHRELGLQAAVNLYARPVYTETLHVLKGVTVEQTQAAMYEVQAM